MWGPDGPGPPWGLPRVDAHAMGHVPVSVHLWGNLVHGCATLVVVTAFAMSVSHTVSPAMLAGPGRSWVCCGVWMHPGGTSSRPGHCVELAGSTIGRFCTTNATPLFSEGVGDSLAGFLTHTGMGASVWDNALATSSGPGHSVEMAGSTIDATPSFNEGVGDSLASHSVEGEYIGKSVVVSEKSVPDSPSLDEYLSRM
jgi:hypothetical protein